VARALLEGGGLGEAEDGPRSSGTPEVSKSTTTSPVETTISPRRQG
jgi:hypothetical protein